MSSVSKRGRSLLLLAGSALASVLVPSLFYVWGHTQKVSHGYRIESARRELRRLVDEHHVLVLERERQRSLERIEVRARSLGLDRVSAERLVIVEAKLEPSE